MDEHGESGLTDYQLRFLLRELLAYAGQAPDKTRLSSIWKSFCVTARMTDMHYFTERWH